MIKSKLILKKYWLKKLCFIGSALLALATLNGCAQREAPIQTANKEQVLLKGNHSDPSDLDPQITTGMPEWNILVGLFEGLVSMHPEDLSPVPGVAKSWDISEDGLTYTFHLRENARWSNGDPLTAHDFVFSYKRILSINLGATYAYTFYVIKGAEDYHKGNIEDFEQVGIKAIDDHTLEIELHQPTPHFLALINHQAWFPVHEATILAHGPMDKRGTDWTRPGSHVSNGPFYLIQWNINDVVVIAKNPYYWDHKTVRLNTVNFYPMDVNTEDRSFRANQLHFTDGIPASKIKEYKEEKSPYLIVSPTLGTEYYLINTEANRALKDKRIRKALSLSLDRIAIVENVTQGGQLPAFHFTPDNIPGYQSKTSIHENIEEAQKLLAEAGYPNGEGFPEIELVYNTADRNKKVAEAAQEMWKKHLGIHVTLTNLEMKVYLSTRRKKDFQIARASWIGDYLDPSTFLDLYSSESGNNFSNWSNAEYDEMIKKAASAKSSEERMQFFQKAETMLLEELPIIPVFFYTWTYLKQPNVKGWHPTLLNIHPYKHVYLD